MEVYQRPAIYSVVLAIRTIPHRSGCGPTVLNPLLLALLMTSGSAHIRTTSDKYLFAHLLTDGPSLSSTLMLDGSSMSTARLQRGSPFTVAHCEWRSTATNLFRHCSTLARPIGFFCGAPVFHLVLRVVSTFQEPPVFRHWRLCGIEET